MWRLLLVVLAVLAMVGVAEAKQQKLSRLKLEDVDRSGAHGRVVFFADDKPKELTFNLRAWDLAATTQREAYAVWLVGAGRSRFLGLHRDRFQGWSAKRVGTA